MANKDTAHYEQSLLACKQREHPSSNIVVIKVHTVQTWNEQNNLQSFDKGLELILFINIHSSISMERDK